MERNGRVEIELDEVFKQGRREFVRFYTVDRGDEYSVRAGFTTFKSFRPFRQRVSDHLGVAIHHRSQDAPTRYLRSKGWIAAVVESYRRTIERALAEQRETPGDEFVAVLCEELPTVFAARRSACRPSRRAGTMRS